MLSSHQATGKKRTDSSIAGASCRNVPPANNERSGKTMGVGGDEGEEESLLISAKTRVKKSRVASHAMSEVLIGAHHSLPSQHESRAAAIKRCLREWKHVVVVDHCKSHFIAADKHSLRGILDLEC